LLIPLTGLPMVAATQVWMVLSALLLIASAVALMRYAAEEFALPLWGRALIALLFAMSPLTVGALALGNVSIAVSALSMLAFARRKRQSPWASGAMLAVALLLKPHLAIWIAAGLLLLAEPAGRRIVLRAVALAAAFCAAVAAWLALSGTLVLQVRSFLAILGAESAGSASMNASSRAPLRALVQITSLSSLVGFWTTNQAVCTVVGWTLALLAAVAIYRLTRSLSERTKLLTVGACCALGMMATYHRSLDGVLLLILLPWAIDRMRRRPLALHAWLVIGVYCAMSVGPDEVRIAALVGRFNADGFRSFVLLRQAALAASLLVMVLVSALARERDERPVAARI
jgi:Glycosyltransferase family 87